jgi:redox-sensitive bicupin YhaK (pirin superfamily)
MQERPVLYRQPRSPHRYQNGPFSMVPNLPGNAIPEHHDHGYGPLARFDTTTLEPGGFVPMHEHRNDEIITYVTDGLVRRADGSGAKLVVSPTKIMVMNAGKGFQHEEGTRPDDPKLHALQIFVRPHTVDLEPHIQFKEIGTPSLNQWRLLAGPENTEAPAFIRNDVRLYDVHLVRGVEVTLPKAQGWDAFIHSYRGRTEVNNTSLEAEESALLVDETEVRVRALENAIVVAFLINPRALMTHAGTIGH